jgi:hypothetical protein
MCEKLAKISAREICHTRVYDNGLAKVAAAAAAAAEFAHDYSQ